MAEDYVLPGDAFVENHIVKTPVCCGQKMQDAGECSDGCCDYFECRICNKRIRLEYS